MKKTLISLGILVLIGGGCASATESQTETKSADSRSDVMDIIKGGSDDQESQAEDSETITVKTDSGMNVTYKPITEEPEAEDLPDEEDGVPVTDVVLGDPTGNSLNMESGNFFFSPNVINASPGEKITISFTKNAGFHTFVIDEINLDYSIKQGEALTFTAPTKSGEYPFYCDVGSHQTFGMEGALIVK